ncbi:MAG: mechanosensitive ion channel family protein [Saprospiraceae bacterium]|nr:mechanosensitive ion channel family protein [Saprospiraceae bacterium]
MMIKRSFLTILFLIISILSVFGQSINRNPQECVAHHLKYTNAKDYDPDKAARSFYGLSRTDAADLANKLKLTYDGMGIYIPVNKIPDNPEYIDSTSNQQKFFILPDRLPAIFVEKIGNAWYYSPDCYNNINEMYSNVYPFGSDLLYDNIPRFDNRKFLGVYLWQYLSFLILIFLAFFSYFILKLIFKPLLSFIADRSFNFHMHLPHKYSKTAKVTSLILIFYVLKYAFALIRLPIGLSSFLITSIDIVIVVLIGILIYRIFDIIISYIDQKAKSTPTKLDDQYIPILQQIAKLIISIGVIFKVLVLLNVDVTAIIAGLSIGGFALALASQDTVKNFIGSVMIFLDKPFKVEDWIEIDKYSGTVKEVGFRSTRIEQLDTSIISIPNNIISNQALVNKGERNLRMYETNIAITFGTSGNSIETYLSGLRKIATEHPKIFGKYYINLSGLGTSSINILFRIYFITNNYDEELKLKENITFLLIELAEDLGIHFALPSQTLYFSKPPKPDNLNESSAENLEILKSKLSEFFKSKNFGQIEDENNEE